MSETTFLLYKFFNIYLSAYMYACIVANICACIKNVWKKYILWRLFVFLLYCCFESVLFKLLPFVVSRNYIKKFALCDFYVFFCTFLLTKATHRYIYTYAYASFVNIKKNEVFAFFLLKLTLCLSFKDFVDFIAAAKLTFATFYMPWWLSWEQKKNVILNAYILVLVLNRSHLKSVSKVYKFKFRSKYALFFVCFAVWKCIFALLLA